MRKSPVLRWMACLLACLFLACASDNYIAPGWEWAPQAKSVLVIQAARTDFERAVERDPDRASAWLHLGSTYAMDAASPTERGINACSQAAEISPGSPAIKLVLGSLHVRADYRALALRHLRSLLASHDEHQAIEAQRLIESAGLIDSP